MKFTTTQRQLANATHDTVHALDFIEYVTYAEDYDTDLVELFWEVSGIIQGMLNGRYEAARSEWIDGELISGQEANEWKQLSESLGQPHQGVKANEWDGWTYQQWDAQVKAWRAVRTYLKSLL